MANDRELRIRITADAQIRDLTRTREELVELKRQAEAMGVSGGDLTARIAAVDAQISALGRRTLPEAKEGFTGLTTQGREFHRLANELNQFLPGLGETIFGVFNPDVLVFAGGIAAFELLRALLRQNAELAKQLRQEMDELSKSKITAWVDSLHEAAAAAADVNTALNTTADLVATIKENETASLDLQKQKTEAVKQHLKALEQVALAEAAGDKEKEAAIRRQFGEKTTGADLAGLAQDIITKQRARGALPDAEALGISSINPEAAAAAVKGRQASAMADLQKQLEQQEKTLQPFVTGRENALNGPGGSYEKQRKFDAANGEVVELQRQAIASTQAQIDALDANVKAAHDQAEANKKNLDDRNKAEKEYTSEINKLKEQLGIQTSSFQADAQLGREAALITQLNALILLHRQEGENMNAWVTQMADTLKNNHLTVMQIIQRLQGELASITHNHGTP